MSIVIFTSFPIPNSTTPNPKCLVSANPDIINWKGRVRARDSSRILVVLFLILNGGKKHVGHNLASRRL